MKRLILLLSVCWLVGCNPAEKFSIVEAGVPSMNGLRSVHGKGTVESSAGQDLMIESAEISISYKERELVTARLMLPIDIPAGEISRVRYDLALENTSLAKLQTLQSRAFISPGQLFVDVKAWIKYGNIRRKVEVEGVPVSEIIANFGLL